MWDINFQTLFINQWNKVTQPCSVLQYNPSRSVNNELLLIALFIYAIPYLFQPNSYFVCHFKSVMLAYTHYYTVLPWCCSHWCSCSSIIALFHAIIFTLTPFGFVFQRFSPILLVFLRRFMVRSGNFPTADAALTRVSHMYLSMHFSTQMLNNKRCACAYEKRISGKQPSLTKNTFFSKYLSRMCRKNSDY